MSNLENLKKQAKALVRLHREHSYHLAVVARETLPKFAGLRDREILAGEFKLSDAQELIARQKGHASWASMKACLSKPSEVWTPVADGPGLLFVVPILYVADVRRSLDCYASKLGFEVLQISGEPPFYAEVRRDGASLGLRLVHAPVIDPAARAYETMLWQASIRVGDIKALYLEFLAAGATIEAPLQRDPFGPHSSLSPTPTATSSALASEGPAPRRGMVQWRARRPASRLTLPMY
jgi:uncharacterized glyoxalase superfamily protein PhnB